MLLGTRTILISGDKINSRVIALGSNRFGATLTVIIFNLILAGVYSLKSIFSEIRKNVTKILFAKRMSNVEILSKFLKGQKGSIQFQCDILEFRIHLLDGVPDAAARARCSGIYRADSYRRAPAKPGTQSRNCPGPKHVIPRKHWIA